MFRSKLEMYISVLETLTFRGSMTTTGLTYKTNVSHSVLKQFLNRLIDQNLIEERLDGQSRIYTITQNGLHTLKCFRELKQMLPDKHEPLPIIR